MNGNFSNSFSIQSNWVPRCDDAFWFIEDKGSGLISMDSKRVERPQSRFCIGFHQDGKLSVQTCTRIKDYKKFYFYPYIAMTSAFFLLLTVIVYTAYPKGGLSDGRAIFHKRHNKLEYQLHESFLSSRHCLNLD